MRHQLSAVAIDATHRKSLIEHHAGIVYQILRGKIISAIDDEILRANEV